MKTKILFLVSVCLILVFANTASAQSASNFSNPGIEYKKAPNTLKIKKHDQVIMHASRFNAHAKTNGNGNTHPYVSKKKKFQKRTVSLNKKHKHNDRGDKAPRTW
jgi:hypothetical protein